jgi:hypothetical protein
LALSMIFPGSPPSNPFRGRGGSKKLGFQRFRSFTVLNKIDATECINDSLVTRNNYNRRSAYVLCQELQQLTASYMARKVAGRKAGLLGYSVRIDLFSRDVGLRRRQVRFSYASFQPALS